MKFINTIKLLIKEKISSYGKPIPLLVLQMGKVASTTVYTSLKVQYKGIVGHAHSFSKDHKEPQIRQLFQHFSSGAPLKVITLIREPIGRNVSAFFENFERDTGVKYADSNFNLEEIREIFLKNYDHDIPLNWFDKHIKFHFNIDVYQQSFSQKGYQIYRNGNVSLLVLKMTLSDRVKESVIKKFAGLKKFRLQNLNIGDEKEYAKTYKMFKSKIKLPDFYLNKMKDSIYFNHFFSQDEISQTIDFWKEQK